jgi:methionyl aminopeptidase
MITLKSAREIDRMAESGALLADVHKQLRSFIKPGITSWDIEVFVRDYIESHGGIAARKKPLKDGDLIKVDMCIDLKGAISDSCWSYVVGNSTPEIDRLMEVTKRALYLGIEQAQVGNRIGDIGHAIQTYAEKEGYGVVRDFVGHGIGPTIHESPMIPHYGEAGKGLRLKEGMVITIEPMINTGTWKMKMDPNGWTAYTLDGGLSCQYEHSLAITKEGPRILTSQGEEGTY